MALVTVCKHAVTRFAGMFALWGWRRITLLAHLAHSKGRTVPHITPSAQAPLCNPNCDPVYYQTVGAPADYGSIRHGLVILSRRELTAPLSYRRTAESTAPEWPPTQSNNAEIGPQRSEARIAPHREKMRATLSS
ncbi:hypothetical protein [Trichothermofontia sp.]